MLVELLDAFEAARPRLLSLAFRIVGTHQDAEDAVQTAWARTQAGRTPGAAAISNPDAWFTTVTARACLDILRARERRGELPLLSEGPARDQISADEAFLRREDISRALLVLLSDLSPRQRAAYVLHELFAVPFTEVAAVLDTNLAAAKKLASRARARLRGAEVPDAATDAEHVKIVEAFLSAARGGDLAHLVTLMAPDAVRVADQRLLPAGGQATVRGAAAIAEETRTFIERIAVAAPIFVAGHPAAVIAPGGHALALIRFEFDGGLVTRIEIGPYSPCHGGFAA